MIRAFRNKDIDRIMELWLDNNIFSHDFIKSEYWKNNYNTVKAMMPSATIYVYEKDNLVQGFVGLTQDYIAGIFVSRQFQSKGIGAQLLDYVKREKDILSLNVYKKNNKAVNFYLREGFSIFSEQIDENTGEIEFSMSWVKRVSSHTHFNKQTVHIVTS